MTDRPMPPSAPASGCPDAEALAGLALGEGTPESRRAIADHVITCPRCAADYRLLREMHAEAAREQPAAVAAVPPARRGWWLAAAAAALAAVALVPLLRQDAGDRVRGTTVPVRPPDGAVLEAPPPELSWPAEEGARAYRVRLFRGDATPLWDSGEVTGTAAALPAQVLEALRGAESAYWTVEALGPVRRRQSGPFWLHFTRR